MTKTLAARALRFVEIVSANTRAGAPGWGELEALVATDSFVLIGPNKRHLDWSDYSVGVDRWAHEAAFGSAVLRIEQVGQCVFLELDESTTIDGQTKRLDSMTVFEFDPTGKLSRVDCFQ